MEGHGTGLLETLVVSLIVAYLGGIGARAIRLPPLVGYVLAGIIVGPFTPGFVADQRIAAELAEIGVALLLFGVGLHFSLSDLLAVKRIAVPGALLQIVFTTLIGAGIGHVALGLGPAGAAIVGLSLAIASTAVATRVLEEQGQLDAAAGRIALGWLVVQDMVVILALVLVPALAGGMTSPSALLLEIGRVALQVLGFVAAVSVVGRHTIPLVLKHAARTGSRELYTLSVIVIALGIAYGSAMLFGVSLALGAFFAGVVLADSDLSYSASAEILPVQQVFTILFFVSVGMIFDPLTMLKLPLEIGAVLGGIVIGTGLTTLLVLLAFRTRPETAALVGVAFSQIGEFSFILTGLCVARGLLDPAVRDIVLAAALLAIVINPLLLPGARWLATRLAGLLPPEAPARAFENKPARLSGHAILVGHGRVGQTVAAALRQNGLAYVVIETNRGLAEALRKEGVTVIYGSATREEVLAAAAPRHARMIVVALPDPFQARQVLETARKLNPDIETVVRTHSEREALYLADAGVGLVVMGEHEIAVGISRFALERFGIEDKQAHATVERLRRRAG